VKEEGGEERKGTWKGCVEALLLYDCPTLVYSAHCIRRDLHQFPPAALIVRPDLMLPYRAHRGTSLSTPHPQGDTVRCGAAFLAHHTHGPRTTEQSHPGGKLPLIILDMSTPPVCVQAVRPDRMYGTLRPPAVDRRASQRVRAVRQAGYKHHPHTILAGTKLSTLSTR
jgi:hypothetical protein